MTSADSHGKLPAFVMLAGTLISLSGLTWDIDWHLDVGPDSFFTLPHLFIYSGGAIAGLTSLVMVLRATAHSAMARIPIRPSAVARSRCSAYSPRRSAIWSAASPRPRSCCTGCGTSGGTACTDST